MLKAWIKRHRDLIKHFKGEYGAFLYMAVLMADLRPKAAKFIERYSIVVDHDAVNALYKV